MKRALPLLAILAFPAGCDGGEKPKATATAHPGAGSSADATPGPRPAPTLLGGKDGSRGYGSIALSGLIPLTADETARVLAVQNRIPLQSIEDPYGRQLEFDGAGHYVDGSCDPAACEGSYSLAGNAVQLDHGTGYRFFMTPAGAVYVRIAAETRGIAWPW